MRLKKVDGVYVVYYKDRDGKTHRKSTQQTERSKAMDVVRQSKIEELERAALAGALNEQAIGTIMAGRSVTIEKALSMWEDYETGSGKAGTTIHNQLAFLRQWVKDYGMKSKPVASTTRNMLMDYVNREDGVSRSTRRARIAALRSFFDYCAGEGLIAGNPSRPLKVNERLLSHAQKEGKARKAFTFGEYRRLVGFLNEFVKDPHGKADPNTAQFWLAAVPLSYWTGLRLGDICNLEWSCFEGDEIIVHTDKRDTRVALPMSDPLVGSDALMEVVSGLVPEHGRYVFPRQRALNMDIDARASLSQDFRRWRDRAGLEATGKTFHCLRHSFVTRLYKAGKTLEEIGRLVAHKNESTTKGYNHSDG
jgi:integrase